ncbi:pyruvate flavodoxin/ferredoxin oxidoreductase domain protein [Caldicellulosiruptor kronotskyensis 2002]|uniref:Pyruvate flavodoxin/ferredoxin oxidoreductase domain protein n=1 Tax=Caldicellulosiruptor kronotskyensis (strain DSM 18902 / VKM B-2412 / 2002) TaxID=632348 RepID=E4SB96_CALK2|nr:thiamine pyrophosphate-dependent enzyme [Caldicellulosiruptor kronotskyensis]ADQ45878.1 pyruvate flavodoxin/ferredoxin oxidoreductase domain protein [Caldicellulosiruptor kronotskyensis 2002]
MIKPQETIFESGNEMAALAASQINYHIMGYYPITPSTQIAEELDQMRADGLHDILLIAADGEHGAAGICYGASLGGGRVFNATSANGLMYALEQLPVQSGTRFPMVLNLVTRSISGPLDIKGDHSDLMFTLNTGWIILLAKDPQRVYDMNIMAVKIGEHPDVNLPVIVAYDGFFTSHQKRVVSYFKNKEDVQEFVGKLPPKRVVAIDPENPVTIGPYMNEPDLINNKYQLSKAMDKAYEIIPQVFEEFCKISGRKYELVEGYRMEDAQIAIFALNSTYDTVCEAVDILRQKGIKVGVATTNVLRPWPKREIQELLKNVKILAVLDRQESYGAKGGNMTIEIKATLQELEKGPKVVSRIYGLGGKDFFLEEALTLFEDMNLVLEGKKEIPDFDYIGAYPGDENYVPKRYMKPIKAEWTKNIQLNTRDLTAMPKRIVPGHGACPGCGIFPNLNLLLKGIEGDVVLLFHTGCGMVVTTAYPQTAFRVTYIHNLFQNGAATLSGLVEMYNQRRKRGEIPDRDLTFILVTGDGGNDIGMGPTIGAALRNHKMIIFEYDNGGYMNTGYQLSYTTPYGASTSTSHVGKAQFGKSTFHKDTPQIMAATNIPYVATVAESDPIDFVKKAKKAQKIMREEGLVYIKALSACPLNWGDEPSKERRVIQAAVDCCFHPLYEIDHGKTTITYDPEKKGKKIPVIEWLSMMGRTKHLTRPEYKHIVEEFQAEVDRRWERLKARHEHPLL